MNDFYIGYLPKPPADLARFLRRAVLVLILTAAVVGFSLVLAQRQFSASFFEFNAITSFEGVIETKPYPTLLVRRPGLARPDEQFSRYLLVGVGKHGADQDVSGFDGHSVALRGKLIYRAGQTIIEVTPGTVRESSAAKLVVPKGDAGPLVTVLGEIVDSKCYTGVMNPGSGKVHHDCAVRCLSGGVPPILVAEENGKTTFYWLAAQNGGPLKKEMFQDRIAERVSVSGQVVRQDDTMTLLVLRITTPR